jgi:tRNA(fMet)-specific endonuclease VapC
MLRFLLDTDHVTLLLNQQSVLRSRLVAVPSGEEGTSIITVEENLRGRLAALARARDGARRIARYQQLLSSMELFAQLPLAAYEQAAEDEFQRLLGLRPRIGTRDLKIAAIALANQVTVLTRNRRDFGHIPGLSIDDWSV